MLHHILISTYMLATQQLVHVYCCTNSTLMLPVATATGHVAEHEANIRQIMLYVCVCVCAMVGYQLCTYSLMQWWVTNCAHIL